jgi:viroplasmin and RNaseH domain-containing protein
MAITNDVREIFCGRIPGVYYDWTFCAAKQVNGFPGAIHQGYQNEEKAKMAYEYYIGGKGVMKQRDLDEVSNSESVHQGLGYTKTKQYDYSIQGEMTMTWIVKLRKID